MPNEEEERLHQTFIEKGLTLSIAESCTGGALAARLTRRPGCSRYFLGSIVSYSNEMKIKVLGVDPHTLEDVGAVSAAVIAQMVHGVQKLTGSDYSVAVSGIAGPEGGTPSKPIGTIWAAILRKGDIPHIWTFQLQGSRHQIIETTVDQLISQLLSEVGH